MDMNALSAAAQASITLVVLFGALAVASVLLSAEWVRLTRNALNALLFLGCLLIVGGVGTVILILGMV